MTADILADIRRRDRLSRKKDRREDYKQLRNEIVKKNSPSSERIPEATDRRKHRQH